MSICLILVMSGGTLLPISAPFPNTIACEMGGAGMVDGQTVKGYVCVPPTIYDCAKPAAPPIPKRQDRME